MARVRQSGTWTEALVGELLRELGGRFRPNVRSLPGSPDFANKARKRAIFVHGCFWHGHECCNKAGLPKTNAQFWEEKQRRNRERDARAETQLKGRGWRVLAIWECELSDVPKVRARLKRFLAD